ncbi:MAG: GMC family oxidoreductase [Deltaproteobacteria bacterium]|nr:GMC family oxidoreductase [Deltaproteobacteria bacterium]
MENPDIIIVGSGYGGMLPAWRLTKAGAKVLLIERGRHWRRHEFQQSWNPLYLKQVYDFAISTSTQYTYRASRVLGGGSVMNSMMHQRTPSAAFEFEDPDTNAPAWPANVSRESLDPYYDETERLLGVRQLEWDEIPMIGGNFARMFCDAGFSADRGRMNLGRACVHCGFCEAGCQFADAKITLLERAYLEALTTRNLLVAENLTVKRIQAKGDLYEVDCVLTGRPLKGAEVSKTFTAPTVILAAGPLGTVPLLMRSKFGLSRLSSALGQWASNNGDVNFVFMTPERYADHHGYKSTNNTGIISYAFWKEHRVTMHPGCSPVPIMAGIDAHFEGQLPWGLAHKHFVKEKVLHRLIPVNAMRQIPSDIDMGIDHDGAAQIRIRSEKNTAEHGRFMFELARKVANGCGGRVMRTTMGKSPLDQGGNHLLGGARMSDSPETGVVDGYGEVYGHSGLFVSDAASIPSALGINPALTIGANALRIADKIDARGAR